MSSSAFTHAPPHLDHAPDFPTGRAGPGERDRFLFDLLSRYAGLDPDDPERPRIREHLVRAYLPLARRLARSFAHRGEPLDDLVQVATIGLIAAIDRFDPDVGSGFRAFATPTIRGEIRRHFRDRGWSMRVSRPLKDLHLAVREATDQLTQRLDRAPRPSELATLLDRPVEDVLAALDAGHNYRADSLDAQVGAGPGEGDGTPLHDRLGSLDPNIEFVEDQHALRPLLDQLPDRERTILLLRFYGNLTQTQIGNRIGLSQMHVSRLLSQTLDWMREQLQTS